jgi:hypothetical protein
MQSKLTDEQFRELAEDIRKSKLEEIESRKRDDFTNVCWCLGRQGGLIRAIDLIFGYGEGNRLSEVIRKLETK